MSAERMTIKHPEWCASGWCEVGVHINQDSGRVYANGHHFGAAQPVRTQGGWELATQLFCETYGSGDFISRDGHEDPLRVAVRIAACTGLDDVDDANKWVKGETALLQPEEAELFARRLLEAAAEARSKLGLKATA